jgi:AMMECR1 domain-containing protein
MRVKLIYNFFVCLYALSYKFQAIIFEEEKPRGEVKRKALGGK